MDKVHTSSDEKGETKTRQKWGRSPPHGWGGPTDLTLEILPFQEVHWGGGCWSGLEGSTWTMGVPS